MNGYDFDKTIYKKDSTIEFYFFILKNNPKLIYHLFYFSFNYFLYILKLKNKKDTKECMFSIFKKISNIDKLVNDFWKDKSLNKWYLNQKKDNDVVISASPYFLLYPMCKKNSIKYLIATNVDKKNGKLLSKNCYGVEKVIRYKEEFKNKKLNAFYTDSLSDECMKKVSKEFFIIKNDTIKKY